MSESIASERLVLLKNRNNTSLVGLRRVEADELFDEIDRLLEVNDRDAARAVLDEERITELVGYRNEIADQRDEAKRRVGKLEGENKRYASLIAEVRLQHSDAERRLMEQCEHSRKLDLMLRKAEKTLAKAERVIEAHI